MKKIGYYIKGMVRPLRNTKAVSALEYAILIGVVATALGAALVAFQGEITNSMTNMQDKFTGSPPFNT